MSALMSKVVSSMVMGLPESISFCIVRMYDCTPYEIARTRDTPIMPMAPAMLVMTVRPFFVNRFCADSLNAVPKDILAFSLPVRLSAFLLPARGVDSAFLSEGCASVVRRCRQRFLRLVLLLFFRQGIGVCVVGCFAVQKLYDTGGVFFGELGIVSDHEDKLFMRNFLD